MDNKTNLVAVFGSLRQNLWNNHILEESELVGTTKTDPIFTMKDLGSFPGLLHHGNSKIEIEVYKVVDNITFARLDRLEGYPNFYNRMIIETEFGYAWIYYNPLQERYINAPTVESGNWVSYLNEMKKDND